MFMLSFKEPETRDLWWIFRIITSVIAFIVIHNLNRAEDHHMGLIISVILYGLTALAIEMILANNSRRLRDAGFSPWLTLIDLLPLVGTITMIIMCGCWPSQTNDNHDQNIDDRP